MAKHAREGECHLPFPNFGPLYRMLEASETPVPAYAQERTSLGFDSFTRLSVEQRASLWGKPITGARFHGGQTRKRGADGGAVRNPSPSCSSPLRPLNAASVEEGEVVERRRKWEYQRGLLSYVLGIDPPRGVRRRPPRCRLRPALRQPHAPGELRPSHENSWAPTPARASQYGREPGAEEASATAIPMLSMSAESDENTLPSSFLTSPFGGAVTAGFPARRRGSENSCSHCVGCCCTDCAESLAELRRAGIQAHRVSKNPYRVLDAPSLPDDFYLNVVDWSGADCVAVGLKGSVLLWNARTSATEVLFSKSGSAYEEIANVSFSPLDAAILCVGFRNGRVELWDVAARKKVRGLAGHKSRCSVSAWSSRQMFLATGARDQSILNRDLRCREPFVSAFKYHQSEVCGLHLSPSERLLASGGNDNLLCVWDVRRTFSSRPCGTDGEFGMQAAADTPSYDFLNLPSSQQSARSLFRARRGGSVALESRPGPPSVGVCASPLSDNEPEDRAGSTLSLPSASPVDAGGGFGADVSPLIQFSPWCTRTNISPAFSPLYAGVAGGLAAASHNLLPYSVSSSLLPPAFPFSRAAHHPLASDLTGSRQAQLVREGLAQQMQRSPSSAQTSAPSGPSVPESVGGVRANAPLFVYKEHHAAVKAVRFSCHADGLLASGGGTADRHIRFWNTNIWTPNSVYRVDTGCQVCNVVFSRNSFEFISSHGFSLNQIFVWDYSPAALANPSPAGSEGMLGSTSLAPLFEPRNEMFHGSNPPVQKVTTLTGHSSRVLFLATSPCGTCVVTGAGRGDETLKFWRVFPLTSTREDEELDIS